MLIYADGGALGHALVAGPEADAWALFAAEHASELITSPLGLTELRRLADPLGAAARAVAHEIASAVAVVRFSDQSLRSAAMASSVVPPFTAIHLGIAVAEPEIDRVATYDGPLARVAVIYGLEVVSPGRPGTWWDV